MKALIGVDSEGVCHSGIHLLDRFDFPQTEATLLHACRPGQGPKIDTRSPDPKDWGQGAAACLDAAMLEMEVAQIPAHSEIAIDSPANALIAHSDEEGEDLVVVGAHERSTVQALFSGSVSRAVAIGVHRSMLIAKKELAHEGPLHLIFATDHSEYADRCLRKFLSMGPKGVGRVDVLAAYDIDDYEATVLHMEMPKLGGMVDEWLEETLHDRSKRYSTMLQSAGYESDVFVIKGKPNDVIGTVMEARQADVLVIGAQGHGFLDTMMIGSVSLHQVVATPYSVLLLRA